MFKNIELAEINADNVFKSIWVLITAVLCYGLLRFTLSNDLIEEGPNLLLIFYGLIQFIFFGWPMWGGFLLVFYLIEHFTMGKKSTEKTVRNLFIVEVGLLCSVLLIIALNNTFDSQFLLICLSLVMGQIIRWMFLKYSYRMYNVVNKQKTKTYGNQ